MRLRSWDDMLHDKAMVAKLVPLDPEDESRWFDFVQWMEFYFPLTKGWTSKIDLWWHYNVRRYPKPPPINLDPVYKRLFGDAEEEI